MLMSTAPILELLRERIQCRFPLLLLSTYEEDRWEAELASLALDLGRGLVIWTATEGAQPPLGEGSSSLDPVEFLQQVRHYPREHVFLLKDFHHCLRNPLVIRQMRDLIPVLAEQDKTLLLMSPEPVVPEDLRCDAISITLPLPDLDELRGEFKDLLIQRQHRGEPNLSVSSQELERLLKTVMGLTARQARQSLSRALLGRRAIDEEALALLISEKRQMVRGSDLLEFLDLAEGAQDIGGLESLKEWISRRAEAFSERAKKQGIPAPKGVLLLGVQGCGKSLTARAVARMLSFPLVRLDVSSLLSSDRGQTERNLRDVLNLMETIAPAVLWLDEVEKGFAGVSEENADSTMQRLLGRFLTWMQEKQKPVFVVATANSVTGLPPEMLRRGRFDELFFVDLPNWHERQQIFEIHLRKRRLDPARFDLIRLADMSEGYSGAEIEQAVVTALVDGFSSQTAVGQTQLERAVEDTVPLSVTMEEKIFELREWARTRCRAATPDSRLLQMLEQEQRDRTGHNDQRLELVDDDREQDDEDQEFSWQSLLKDGDIQAGLLEYVARSSEVSFDRLQKDLSPHLEVTGKFGLALRSDPNVVVCLGLSTELAAPLSRLVNDRKLYLQPVAAGEEVSSAGITLPRLPALPDSRVSRPCWLPVTLSIIAPETVDDRLTRIARMMLNK